MPLSVSFLVIAAMNPTASRLECTFKVTILHGKAYSKLWDWAEDLVVMIVSPSASLNSIWVSKVDGYVWAGGMVMKTNVSGSSLVVSVDRRDFKLVSPGAGAGVTIFME